MLWSKHPTLERSAPTPDRDRDRDPERGHDRNSAHEDALNCDACGEEIEGEPAGRGLLLFVRGDDVVREEPPLCERCALAISMTALAQWDQDEGDG